VYDRKTEREYVWIPVKKIDTYTFSDWFGTANEQCPFAVPNQLENYDRKTEWEYVWIRQENSHIYVWGDDKG